VISEVGVVPWTYGSRIRGRFRGAASGLLRMGALPSVMLLLASCGRGTSEGTVIRFWALGAEGDNIRQLLPEFERRYPGITVKVQSLPWTAAHEKLLTSYAGNSMPDLFQLGNTWIPEFQVLGALEDLRPWLGTSSVVREEAFFPGVWETNRIDSALVGIPWYVDTRVLFYRTDLCAAAGYVKPPATWGEWKDLARKLRQMAEREGRDAYAILLPTNEWAPPTILALQRGASMLKERNTRGAFSDSLFRSAFEFYCSFFHEHLAPVGVTQVTNIYQGFAEGFFAMYITGPWNIGEFRRRLPAAMQGKWMTAPLPGPRGPGVSLAGGSSLAMARGASNKDAVWKLMEFLVDPEQQREFYRITGNLPARREVWEDPLLSADPYLRAFRAQLGALASPPPIPQWEQIAMKVQDCAEIGSVGTTPVAEILARLDRDVDVILEKRRWLVSGE
jgi:multiple sugar transport system substrate-binding protein